MSKNIKQGTGELGIGFYTTTFGVTQTKTDF